MTTVGYGDMYPQTHAGRFFGVISFIIGNFLVSVIVVTLITTTDFTPRELKAYKMIKQASVENSAEVKAANVIRMALRLA